MRVCTCSSVHVHIAVTHTHTHTHTHTCTQEKGTRYSPAGPDGYVSNQGVALSNQGLALAPNLPHASGPLPNGALPSRPRNSSRYTCKIFLVRQREGKAMEANKAVATKPLRLC